VSEETGEKYKKYGERFVQIKKKLCQWADIPMEPNFWLDKRQLNGMKFDFALLSRAFDVCIYKEGRRKTVKDEEVFQAEGEGTERRHNMLNYNFVQRELIWKNFPQLWHKCAVDFFFPLPVRHPCFGRGGGR
jgi:hypothetical protein